MDIRIECVAGVPPAWKVFLGEFFWSCSSREEAESWAAKAASFVAANKGPSYQLPAPYPAIRTGSRNNGNASDQCYDEVVAEGSAKP